MKPRLFMHSDKPEPRTIHLIPATDMNNSCTNTTCQSCQLRPCPFSDVPTHLLKYACPILSPMSPAAYQPGDQAPSLSLYRVHWNCEQSDPTLGEFPLN